MDNWLEHARTITAASTYRGYRRIALKEVIPAFGTPKLVDLTAGLRRALKGREGEGVKLAQGGEETYLTRQVTR